MNVLILVHVFENLPIGHGVSVHVAFQDVFLIDFLPSTVECPYSALIPSRLETLRHVEILVHLTVRLDDQIDYLYLVDTVLGASQVGLDNHTPLLVTEVV